MIEAVRMSGFGSQFGQARSPETVISPEQIASRASIRVRAEELKNRLVPAMQRAHVAGASAEFMRGAAALLDELNALITETDALLTMSRQNIATRLPRMERQIQDFTVRVPIIENYRGSGSRGSSYVPGSGSDSYQGGGAGGLPVLPIVLVAGAMALVFGYWRGGL